jgi:CubicO group peptidase (beta-lactamase class C family)
MKKSNLSIDEWKLVNPESLNVNSELLFKVDNDIKKRLNGVNGVLIVKKGHLIFEKYYNNYNENSYNYIASITKSIISALIGIAIDKGFIKSVDQRVLDFFPEFDIKNPKEPLEDLTLKNLLTMKTGFLWNERRRGPSPMLNRLKRQKDWIKFILSLPIIKKKINTFQYNSAVSHLLSAIISTSTNLDSQSFANKFLFKTIGIEEFQDSNKTSYKAEDIINNNKIHVWLKDPQGINIGGWGITMKARDLAKFGLLYLNLGIWEKNQIISSNWIKDSIKDHVEDSNLDSGMGYSYHWWIWKITQYSVFNALGAGGQVISCIPELDLVIVITANANLARWKDPLYLIGKYIIPAIQ